MSGIFKNTEMNEKYQEDDDFNQQEELVSDQYMMDEQNEFEQDFRDEFTEGAYFSESNQSEDILEAAYAVDSVQDITTLNFSKNFTDEISKYHFSTLQLAFDFYLKYSKSKGFSARKSKTFKNSVGEIYKQKFVCHRQGFREEKYYTMEKRKKEPRLETRTRWISTSQIFGLLASQAGGYEFVGYGPRDMYNEIARQRRQIPSDAARVLKKLEAMRLKDPQLYFKACHDSRDGAMAIRNAVRVVFFKVRHRLCAWHLIRNATSNVGNPSFTSKFRKIMLGDYEIPVFKHKWVHLIEEFGLEDKPWVINMYEEKHMWATAYIRGKFFAGFRTTSRCEGLHSVVARYVGSRYDLISFVEHFQRMESFGIPCEHIVKVLVDRDICEIPRSLVLDRWTKKVKSALNDPSGFMRDAVVISRQSALMEFSKQLAAVAAKVPERYEETRDLIMGLYSSYKAADEGTNQPQSGVAKSSNPYVHQSGVGSRQPSRKKRQRCSVCQMEGHKKTTCPWKKDIDNNVIEDEANGSDDGNVYPESTAELDSDN
ncbi:hypothetical protein Ahy_B01g053339 [Arachis hypogaea]|uniref:FAR1 domain-containing protein n=1 Tax=Arachis hypogaea TaxID=3818 RepID=A0A445ARL6_ARAHY|nr:hypothetical protein Ahy_B01g053339 [Arachis hypogaea]